MNFWGYMQNYDSSRKAKNLHAARLLPAGTGRLYGVAGQASAVIGYGMLGLAGAIGSGGQSGLDSPGQSPFARRG